MTELVVGGDRLEIIDADRAREEIVPGLQQQLLRALDAAGGETLRLVRVDLSCRSYTPDGAMVVAGFLASLNLSHVTHLQLNDVIAGQPKKEGFLVFQTLANPFWNSPLETADFSDNALGSKGIHALESSIAGHHLKNIHLDNCGLAAESIGDLTEYLEEAFPHLRVLHLHNNMIGPEGAPAVANLIAQLHSLVDFRYSGCRSGPEGTLAVVNGLLRNGFDTLERLDLEGCTLRSSDDEDAEDAIVPLCEMLTRQLRLTHVNLADTNLGADGMERLNGALLESRAPIVSLVLSENELEAEGAAELAVLLDANRETLEEVILESNEFSSAGVENLAAVFRANPFPALAHLNLKTNLIGDQGAVALLDTLLPNLERLDLDENGFAARTVERLKDHFGDALASMDENEPDAGFDDDESEEEELEDDFDDDDFDTDAILAQHARRFDEVDDLADVFNETAPF